MHQNCSETWCSTKEIGTIEAETIVGFASGPNDFTKSNCWGWAEPAGTWAAAGPTAALSSKAGAHHRAQQPRGQRGVCSFPPGPKGGRWCPRAHIPISSFPLTDTHCRERARPYPHPKDLVRHKDMLGHQPGSHWVLACHFGAGPGGQESLYPWRKRKWESAVNRCDSKWELAVTVPPWTLMACKPQMWNKMLSAGEAGEFPLHLEPGKTTLHNHSFAAITQGIAQPRGR